MRRGGQIVLFNFPRSDLAQGKRRTARQWPIVLSAFLFFIASIACGVIDDDVHTKDKNLGTPPWYHTPRPTRTLTPIPASDDEAIRQVIRAEGEAVVQWDIDRLQWLWAPDGRVIDAKHTPTDTSDDLNWANWPAIRDRYVNVLFPSRHAIVDYYIVRLTINGDKALAISDSMIGGIYLRDDDQWTLQKTDGRWRITALTVHLSPEQ